MISTNSYLLADQPAVRICLRLWSAYTKYIRQQCKKDRVVDSLFFGTFAKSPKQDSTDEDENIQYKMHADANVFPGLKVITKLEDIPAGTEVLPVNLASIAQICGCSQE
jgi:hypothetical protein